MTLLNIVMTVTRMKTVVTPMYKPLGRFDYSALRYRMIVAKTAQNFVALLSSATYALSSFFYALIAVVTVAADMSELELMAAECRLFLNEC